MTKAFKPSLLVKQNREVLFRVGILLKGFNGFLEILGGVALFSVGPQFLLKVVRYVTQDEIAEDPHDLVANFLRHIATHLSISGIIKPIFAPDSGRKIICDTKLERQRAS